jgi:hypothetical protein
MTPTSSAIPQTPSTQVFSKKYRHFYDSINPDDISIIFEERTNVNDYVYISAKYKDKSPFYAIERITKEMEGDDMFDLIGWKKKALRKVLAQLLFAEYEQAKENNKK